MPVEGALGQADPVGDHRDGRLVVPLLGEQLKRSHDESLARPVPSAACMH
jgi:hypothetical protein